MKLYKEFLEDVDGNAVDKLNKWIKNYIKVIIFKPSKEVIDPSTIQGKMMMDMLLMFADLEHDSIKQRMQNGRVGEKDTGGKSTKAHTKLKKCKVYESIYNAYVRKLNDKHLYPKNL